MWKKFLAAMAIVATFATSTASAIIVDQGPGDGSTVVDYVQGFSMNPTTVNTAVGGTSVMNFTLSQDVAKVHARITKASTSTLVATLVDNLPLTAGAKTYTWYATAGNVQGATALDAGDYKAEIFAYDATNNIVDYDLTTVTLVSTPAVNQDAPKLTNVKADPTRFAPNRNQDTELSFDVDKGAYITAVVKQGTTTVRTFVDYKGRDSRWYPADFDHSILWDGENNDGSLVANGTYTFSVTAEDDSGANTATVDVVVDSNGYFSDGVLKDVHLDRTTFDPSDEDPLEISGELLADVSFFQIEARRPAGTSFATPVEIIDEDDRDDGDFDEEWDGTDEDGDFVNPGEWIIIVRADGDKVEIPVTVEYEQPEISEAFVTKDSFDPSKEVWNADEGEYVSEFTNLVVKANRSGLITVEVFKGSRKEFTLVDEEEVSRNRWYAYKWDGKDEDGDYVDEGTDWKFKITLEHETDDDIFDTETVEVDVQKDEVSDSKVNVYLDYTKPVAFDDREEDDLNISWYQEDEAEIFLAIYEGTSTSGRDEVTLLDYQELSAGYHTATWPATDEDDRRLDDGIYTYKLISRDGTHKDTEIGRFVIGNTERSGRTPEPEPEPPVYDSACADQYVDLAYLTDASELCRAIAWATDEGIFSGDSDESGRYDTRMFRPYEPINRAEALKVVFKTFENVTVLPIDGTNLGFSDINPFAWYTKYVRTGLFYGMADGNPDGTFAPNDDVNRVELLKFVLEASNKFSSYELPLSGASSPYSDVDGDEWYAKYTVTAYEYGLYDDMYGSFEMSFKLNPNADVERGEVALLLYRMELAGLLN